MNTNAMMNPFTFITSMLHGRPPWVTITMLVTAGLQTMFYTAVMLFYIIGVWISGIDATIIVLPFVVPGIAATFYQLGLALQYKDLPSILVCFIGILLVLASMMMTIPAMMWDWPGMTRLGFFHETALTELSRMQNQASFIIIFILLVFKLPVELLTLATWVLSIVTAFMRKTPIARVINAFGPRMP